MRRTLRLALIAASLVASTAFASPTNPQNGVEYVTLAAPQPVQATGKKVEVVEFFAYHCPACYALEPGLNAWVKKQGDNIVLRRVHLPFQGPNDPEAHLFLTLEAMGKLDEMHSKIFHAVHVQRVRLMKDEQIIDWVSKNGIDRAGAAIGNAADDAGRMKQRGQVWVLLPRPAPASSKTRTMCMTLSASP